MMDVEERELFAKSLERATAQHDGAALDAALDEMGWRDALVADPQAAVATLFERQGAAGTTSSALDDVIAAAAGLDPAADLGVVLPPLGRTDPPGQVAGEHVAVGGLGTARMARGGRTVIVALAGAGSAGFEAFAGSVASEPAARSARSAGSDALAASATSGAPISIAVTVAAGDLGIRTVEGIDPRLGLVEVGGDQIAVDATTVLDAAAWAGAVAAGQRALAHELVGASRTMLDLAREHALERVQFGRPIAQFQAVRHRLAESLVAIEAADGAATAAWDDGTPLAAALAKALAGRGARTVARHAQQVLAGIGFTTEHPLHGYVRRVVVLDRLLGDARSLTRRLGDDLLAHRSLPSMLPL